MSIRSGSGHKAWQGGSPPFPFSCQSEAWGDTYPPKSLQPCVTPGRSDQAPETVTVDSGLLPGCPSWWGRGGWHQRRAPCPETWRRGRSPKCWAALGPQKIPPAVRSALLRASLPAPAHPSSKHPLPPHQLPPAPIPHNQNKPERKGGPGAPDSRWKVTGGAERQTVRSEVERSGSAEELECQSLGAGRWQGEGV